jgi:predicted permease
MLRELWSDLRYRLRRLVRRDAVDRELRDEMEFHIEREAEKLRRSGIAADDAMRQARLSFGGMTRIADDTRDAHGTMLLEQLAQDLRYALRGMRARPLFAVAIVATFALGIGANTAMFGVIDRQLFRPSPYLHEPSTVNRVLFTWNAANGKRVQLYATEYDRFRDVARWSRSIEKAAAFTHLELSVGDGANTRKQLVGVVSAELFDFFDAPPVLGRYFSADEDTPKRPQNVVVLAYDYWKERYGGRPDALGTSITIGAGRYTVVGVAPRGFTALSDTYSPALFVPVTSFGPTINRSYDHGYSWRWLRVIVRRLPRATPAAVEADLTSALQRSWNAEREQNTTVAPIDRANPRAIATPAVLARGPVARDETMLLVRVAGVAVIVLLIACANVANLLLTRAIRRSREMSVRRALGGSRGRLVRQLLTETLLLAGTGAIVGLGAAQLSATALRRMFFEDASPISILGDARTAIFALAVTLVTALVAGVAPALRASDGKLAGVLKAGMRDTSYRRSRLRLLLLGVQAALGVVLLVGAGLFIRSLAAARSIPLGYDVDPVALVQTDRRGTLLDDARLAALGEALVAEAKRVPGVADASLTLSVPFWSSYARPLRVPGIDSVQRLGFFSLQAASPEYFATIGTRILRGRAFDRTDRPSGPRVAVVSSAMAKALWPDADPLGQCVYVGDRTVPCTMVVGVAENVKADQLTGDAEYTYYLPLDQYRAAFGAVEPTLLVRAHGSSDLIIERLRSALQSAMPGSAYVSVLPLRAAIDPTMHTWKVGAQLFAGFAALALTLAAIGVYAVIAFGVSQRTHEIGVRMALGAARRDIVGLVLGEGLVVTGAGVIAGMSIALAGSRTIAPLLYGVSPRDPVVYGVVALLLLAIGAAASAVPARRAAGVDPSTALRSE